MRRGDQLLKWPLARLPVLAGDGFDGLGRSFHLSHRSKNLFRFGPGLIKPSEALGKLVGAGSLFCNPVQSQADSSCLRAELQAGIRAADGDQRCFSSGDRHLCMPAGWCTARETALLDVIPVWQVIEQLWVFEAYMLV